MVIQKVSTKNIGQEYSLRNDFEYLRYFNEFKGDYYLFNDLFEFPNVIEINRDDLYNDFLYCEIGNIDKEGNVFPESLNFENRDLSNESYYKKIEKGDILRANNDDILISKVRPNLKKFVRITEENNDIYFTSAFIRVKPKILPEILYYCLRDLFYDNLVAISRQGKGYPTINTSDLKNLRIDKTAIDRLLDNSVELTKRLLEVEKQITDIKSNIKEPQDIIDSVFEREFNINTKKLKKIDNKAYFFVPFSSIDSQNKNLRCSFRWNKAMEIQTELRRMTSSCQKLGNYIIDSKNGWSPECSEMATSYRVLSLDAIDRSGVLFFEKTKLTDITRNDINKFIVKDGDLFVSRGNGSDELIAMASVAVISDFDMIDTIYPDIMIKIDLSSEIDKKYVAYAFNSTFGRLYFKNVAKGSNKKKITPLEISDFSIPLPAIDKQKQLVDEIQMEFNKQEKLIRNIAELKDDIYELIRSTGIGE